MWFSNEFTLDLARSIRLNKSMHWNSFQLRPQETIPRTNRCDYKMRIDRYFVCYLQRDVLTSLLCFGIPDMILVVCSGRMHM